MAATNLSTATHDNFLSIRDSLGWLNWLFRPHPSLKDELSQRRSNMLAGMIFMTILVGIIGLALTVIEFGVGVLDDLDTWLIIFTIGIVFVTFLINRSGRINTAAKLFILITTVAFVGIPFIPGAVNDLIYFTVVPILLTAIFFSTRATIQIAGVLTVIVTVMTVITQSDWNLYPVYFLLIAGAVIVLFIKHLQYQEGLRAKELERINRQLQDSEENLERRVQDRTRDLQVAADVSLQITTQLDQSRLLADVVEQTAQAFGLYHVSIFLYDEQEHSLQLKQGVGSSGNQMVAMGKQFKFSDTGLVPDAARTQQPTLSNDVAQEPKHFVNPLLPETRSELAIPMIYRGTLIGVLDLQSELVGRFGDEDIRIMRTLADQVAIAVRNSQLFEETNAAKEEAVKADKVKSAFLASMSHELRTPLNAIINFSKFLKKGIPGPVNEEQEQLMGSIADSGQHLLNLINDVLDMSKIEAGALKLFVESGINLRAIIESAIEYTHPLLADKQVEIFQDVPEGLPLLTGDRKRLLQIFLNLLSNACKFTEHGYVKIRVRHELDRLMVSVEDTGTGIAPEDSGHVFTAFKQTESGLRQGGGGTGLGMPICQKLVEAHEGSIWFESELNVGTTFYVELPLQTELEPERGKQNA